jgi:hypothetical protein
MVDLSRRKHGAHATAPVIRNGSSVLGVTTQAECEQAVRTFAERYAALDAETRNRHALARTLACRVPDLDVVFLARIDGDTIRDLRCHPGTDNDGAQVRLATSSDDLVDLLHGRLTPAVAWATGRLKIEASVLDLLRLRTLL